MATKQVSAQTELSASPLDYIKWLVALGLIVAGIWAFYEFENEFVIPIRALGLIAVFGLAVAIATWTAHGRAFMSFMKAANVERQKVVWPTRPETVQTTIVVFVVVIFVGLFIWLLDWIFSSSVTWLVG